MMNHDYQLLFVKGAATNHLSRDCCDLLLAQAQALQDIQRPKPQDLDLKFCRKRRQVGMQKNRVRKVLK